MIRLKGDFLLRNVLISACSPLHSQISKTTDTGYTDGGEGFFNSKDEFPGFPVLVYTAFSL